jgi:predicted ATPase
MVFITRVVLKDYRSIKSCDIPLGPMNFLVGPNRV